MSEKGGRGPIRAPQDFVGGVLLVAVAAAAYTLTGNLSSMRGFQFGAGTAPRLFAMLLGSLGLLIIVLSFIKRGPPLERFPWRGPVMVLGAVLFFALTIRVFGVAITGFLTVLIASFSAPDARLKESAIFGAAVTAFCALLFPIILGQPIPLWPPALVR